MSIRKMIALHPDVQGHHVNQPLGDAVHHLMYCAKMCLSCADVCEAACRVALRRSGSNEEVLRDVLELCARVCEACAAECEKHDHEHCKLCAQICRECAADCRHAALAVFEPV